MLKLLRRMRYLFRRRRMEADLAEEMEYHRELLAREFAGDRKAALAWGNATLAREDARSVWLAPWIESFWRDFTYAVRGLWRERAFTAVAVGALAIAIGLNAGLFTVFNAMALRPWPVKDPSRVVNVTRIMTRSGPMAGWGEGFGVAEWRYIAQHSKAFSGLLLTRNGERVQAESGPMSLTWVSGNYFAVLGIDMARGRGFLVEEDRVLAPEAVAVLSYGLWQNRFGSDPSIVGKTVRLDEIPFVVVGVGPEGFAGTDPSRAGLWAPLSARRLLRPNDADVLPFLTNIHHCCSLMAGRLAPGYTREQAAAEVSLLLDQAHADEPPQRPTVLTSGTALVANIGHDKHKVVPALAAMFIGMTLVLLLACANVGNLLLARAAARRSEIAVRLSLGGSRARLVRQLLVESLTLAIAAAAVGLAIAATAPAALMARIVPENALTVSPDWLVCLYTAGLTVLACVVFGLAPAIQATHGAIAGALKREATLRFSHLPLRSVLLAAQVAISVVLLAGAGLLVRSLQDAQHRDPGFRMAGVSMVKLELPAAVYDGKRSLIFTAQLTAALNAPGMPVTAISNDAPLGNSHSWTTARSKGQRENQDKLLQIHRVSGGYFEVLHIPLVVGRNFTAADATRRVTILNETAARQIWGGATEALGKTIDSAAKDWEVVGIVKDTYSSDLNTITPTMYWPNDGSFGIPVLLVGGSGAELRERIAGIVRGLEPKAQLTVAPLDENLQSYLAPARYAAILAGVLGLLALGLASIGMSGVFAYMVRQRTREIGLRMALGARAGQVVWLVLASHLRPMAWGLAVGLAGALAGARLLRSIMSGVSPFDPMAYLGVLALLVFAATAASALPARRATRVDPVSALRWE